MPTDRRAVRTFSGGERQRIALAADPDIVLAGEPTEALDAAAKSRVVDDLLTAVRTAGRTLLAVSHDETLLAALDRTITITDGTIAP